MATPALECGRMGHVAEPSIRKRDDKRIPLRAQLLDPQRILSEVLSRDGSEVGIAHPQHLHARVLVVRLDVKLAPFFVLRDDSDE